MYVLDGIKVCWRGAMLFWGHSARLEAATRAKWEGKMPCGSSISMVTSGLSLHRQIHEAALAIMCDL